MKHKLLSASVIAALGGILFGFDAAVIPAKPEEDGVI